ncbi:restriction endonuclease [Streptomyces sp. NPDC093984]|uniref:restriction endonuclease n=1 Tax=Streptomyces sp. NPDC093984 TaxID=3366052 RepID=UPI00381F3C4B
MDWDMRPGDVIRRSDLHERYGGRRQGGIGPSRVSNNVFLFTNPPQGRKHGYYDGWGQDDRYHYCGEGQSGDQKMTQGNLTVLNHQSDGRALRLFQATDTRSEVQYVGEFELDKEQPYYLTDAPATDDGRLRSVIVFRLRPIDTAPRQGFTVPFTPATTTTTKIIPVEQQITERSLVNPSQEPHEAERREAGLVLAYQDWLLRQGHEVGRHQILPPGESKPLLTDLIDSTRNVLVEAKGTITREAIRMAIGQLMDYQRFIDPRPSLAILVPSRPRADLIDLCRAVDIEVIWPDGEGFDTA